MGKRQADQLIRVLVVESAAERRDLLIQMIGGAPGFALAGAVGDGAEALEAAQRLRPDIVVMDINLPTLDGCEVTRQIMQRCPTPIVLMSSDGEDMRQRTVAALSAGALVVVRPPEPGDNPASLLRALRLMADVPVVTRHSSRLVTRVDHTPSYFGPASQVYRALTNGAGDLPADTGDLDDLDADGSAPQVLAIAASTGGPAAIQILLNGLGSAAARASIAEGGMPALLPPILIAQHIARGFVGALAEWLCRTTPLPVQIAADDQRLLPGRAYLAAEGQHLLAGRDRTARLMPAVEGDRYCPSADALFESVAHVYGARAVGVVLTGMGDDGARGLRALRATGALTFAQDEASCVVYGMPQAAVAIGAVERVEPLADLAEVILNTLR